MEKQRYLLSNNIILEIEQDDDAETPDNWGNTDMFLVYAHRSFQVDREGFEPRDIYNYTIHEDDHTYDDYFIFPVYAYIHSGVSLSLGNSSYPFNDRWDVSTTGFILVSKTDLDFELQRKSNKELVDKTDQEIAEHYAEGLIETWNCYLSGNIYGFRTFEKVQWTKTYEDGTTEEGYDLEDKDSCWGFYETEDRDELIQCMLEHIEGENITVIKEL